MRKVTFTPYKHKDGYRAKYDPEGLNVRQSLIVEMAEIMTDEPWIKDGSDSEYCYIFCAVETKPFKMELIEDD